MEFKPQNDRILVLRTLAEEHVGLLYIPEEAREKSLEGTVIAVGPGKRDKHGEREPISVLPNDKIIFGKLAGVEITLDGVEYLLIQEHEVISKILPKII